MAKIAVFDMAGQQVSERELSDAVFAVTPNEAVMHAMVVNYLANQRQGTQSTLTRTEVAGGGRKPWRQKGTGNARQGSIRAPQWIKGGVVFAPKSRDFSKKMNKFARRGALLSAISKRLADNDLYVIDNIAVKDGKTKEMVEFMKAFKFEKSVLIVMSDNDSLVIRAARNIGTLQTLPVNELNTYDVVKNSVLVMSADAVDAVQELYGSMFDNNFANQEVDE